jgi:hypothetical protein
MCIFVFAPMSVSVDMRMHICIRSSEVEGKGKNHRGIKSTFFQSICKLFSSP